MQTRPVCVLIPSLSLYSSCSGRPILSLWVFLSILPAASVFTEERVRALVRRVLPRVHPCGLVGGGEGPVRGSDAICPPSGFAELSSHTQFQEAVRALPSSSGTFLSIQAAAPCWRPGSSSVSPAEA